MTYYKAWYCKIAEAASLNSDYPDWVIYAFDENAARVIALRSIGRAAPARGYQVHLAEISDEDDGMMAFARARQNGQALM